MPCKHLVIKKQCNDNNTLRGYDRMKPKLALRHARDPYSPARQPCESCGYAFLEYTSLRAHHTSDDRRRLTLFRSRISRILRTSIRLSTMMSTSNLVSAPMDAIPLLRER